METIQDKDDVFKKVKQKFDNINKIKEDEKIRERLKFKLSTVLNPKNNLSPKKNRKIMQGFNIFEFDSPLTPMS